MCLVTLGTVMSTLLLTSARYHLTVVRRLIPLNFGHNSWLIDKARVFHLMSTVDHDHRVVTVAMSSILDVVVVVAGPGSTCALVIGISP